jgi:predicted Zn-dependent peptidase
MKHTVSEHHLAGGAAGLVIDVPGSDVVSIQIRFNSGYQFADRKLYEVPHVMEHLLATVTQKHPQQNAFIIDAQRNGAYFNASTSVDMNGYIYECADFELDRILDLVEEQVAEPLFEPKSLEAELSNVREELSRNTTQHATVCSIQLAERSFPQMWLNFDERIEQLEQIKLDNVREHYERTHTSANCRFVIAGSFPDGGAKLVKRLDKTFRRLPAGERLRRSLEIGRDLEQPVVTQRDIQQLYYRVVMYFGELTEAETRAMTLLRLVLVGGMGARILGEARRRGLAYGVSGAGHAEPGNSSFGFLGYVTPKNAEALFQLITREFAAVRDGQLTEAELGAAKDLLIGSLKRSTQNPGDILGWYLEPYDESGEIRDFARTMDLLREVRLDELQAVAKTAAQAHRRGISFVGSVDDEQSKAYAAMLEPLWHV